MRIFLIWNIGKMSNTLYIPRNIPEYEVVKHLLYSERNSGITCKDQHVERSEAGADVKQIAGLVRDVLLASRGARRRHSDPAHRIHTR